MFFLDYENLDGEAVAICPGYISTHYLDFKFPTFLHGARTTTAIVVYYD